MPSIEPCERRDVRVNPAASSNPAIVPRIPINVIVPSPPPVARGAPVLYRQEPSALERGCARPGGTRGGSTGMRVRVAQVDS